MGNKGLIRPYKSVHTVDGIDCLGGAIGDRYPLVQWYLLDPLFPPYCDEANRATDIVEYRCIYLKSDDWMSAVINLGEDSYAPAYHDVQIEVGYGGKNVVADTIADRYTAPSGITFHDLNYWNSNPVEITLDPGDSIVLWAKRTIASGTRSWCNYGGVFAYHIRQRDYAFWGLSFWLARDGYIITEGS